MTQRKYNKHWRMIMNKMFFCGCALLMSALFLFVWVVDICAQGGTGGIVSTTGQVVPVISTLPSEIVETLRRNAVELDPISISWDRTRVSSMDFETLIKKTGCLYDCGFLEPVFTVFKWQEGRAYIHITDKNAIEGEEMLTAYEVKRRRIKLVETVKERSFDGEKCYIGSGHKRSETNTPNLGIYSAEQAIEQLPFFTICYPEYLTCAGYKFPLDAPELRESQISLVLYLINNGSLTRVEYDDSEAGDSKILVEIIGKEIWTKKNHRYRFWLSKNLNFAIEKYEIESLEGDKAYQVLNSGFFRVPGRDVYLPKMSTQKCYTYMTIPGVFSATPLFVEEYRLIDISTEKISEEQFDISLKYTEPGTYIGDRTLADTEFGVQYRMPANPADLDRVIEAARTGGTFTPTPIGVPGLVVVIRWLTCIAGLLMILWAARRIFLKIINR